MTGLTVAITTWPSLGTGEFAMRTGTFSGTISYVGSAALVDGGLYQNQTTRGNTISFHVAACNGSEVQIWWTAEGIYPPPLVDLDIHVDNTTRLQRHVHKVPPPSCNDHWTVEPLAP